MSGNDREPIGRKGKPLPPRSSAGRGRRRDIEQDIDQDDFNDDEEEAPPFHFCCRPYPVTG